MTHAEFVLYLTTDLRVCILALTANRRALRGGVCVCLCECLAGNGVTAVLSWFTERRDPSAGNVELKGGLLTKKPTRGQQTNSNNN